MSKRINEGDPNFDFVHLKIKKISSDVEGQSTSVVIQIIDMSDKMLYNEAKAEQTFSTLMNAAVSHELRNPLSSLISGIDAMKQFL